MVDVAVAQLLLNQHLMAKHNNNTGRLFTLNKFSTTTNQQAILDEFPPHPHTTMLITFWLKLTRRSQLARYILLLQHAQIIQPDYSASNDEPAKYRAQIECAVRTSNQAHPVASNHHCSGETWAFELEAQSVLIIVVVVVWHLGRSQIAIFLPLKLDGRARR